MSTVFDERKEWLEQRALGLGGTDISAVLNLNPWKKPLDVYLGKLGKTEQREPTDAMWWGAFLERGIVMRYAETTGNSVVPPKALAEMFPGRGKAWNEQTIIQHADYPFVLGTPDGMILGKSRGLEIKAAAFKSAEWGKPGTDEVPDHYRLQVAWYMAITGADAWDIAVLFSGNRLELYTVGRDRELEETILGAGVEFWQKYVTAQTPPPIDGSEQWSRHLARSFAVGSQNIIEASTEAEPWAQLLREAAARKAAAEQDERLAKNELAALIGSSKAIKLASGGKAQWIRPRAEQQTDWEALARDLAQYAALPVSFDNFIQQHTAAKAKTAYVRLFDKGGA